MPPEMITIVAPTAMIGEEARVGRSLDQRVGVEEVVDLGAGEPIDVRAGEQRQHGAEEQDDQHQPGLL